MSATTYLVLDIETVPDGELHTPPEPAPGAERPFPPLYANRPVVMGVMWLAEDLSVKRLGTVGDGQREETILSDFAELMAAGRPRLVTWNGRGFDLPVLALRSLRHGLSWSWYYGDGGYRDRHSPERHLDLCDFLADHGAARRTSLDGAARLIGLPGKDGMDGSQVEALWNAGQIETLSAYCLADVTQTAFLFLRCRLLAGQLDRAGYRRAAEAMLAAVAADPRTARLAERADRARLLLS
jgi:3'-5' exonuclease